MAELNNDTETFVDASQPSRRTVVKGAAWALPVAGAAVAAPLAAATVNRLCNATDYFLSRGQADAHRVLVDGTVTQYVSQIAPSDPNDGASLAHMIASLDSMKEGNAIRVSLGLAPWQVGDTMMAIAIASADWAASNTSHPNQFDTVENLAWGASDPWPRWYDQEKVIYDDALANPAQYPGLASMTAYQVYQNFPALYSQVGHYLNIIDPGSTMSGFAISTRHPLYGTAYAQVMLNPAWPLTSTAFPGKPSVTLDKGRIMPVDDYLADLIQYQSTATCQ